ncbi:MAG: glycine cleavage protein (aminomethyl transferase) [Bryobacterales bacterium]|nr:glycine cleavage protein (aminomethyl transferase) [Bryobacterales bacterium]
MNSYEALRSDAAAIDLSARGKIRVTGEDRARLVHAMSTNQVNDLKEGGGVYAFFLTAQGRILADAYIYNLGDSLFLDTEPELGVKLLEHLDRYIIADDAEVHDETANWAVIGLEGPRSFEHAKALGIAVPEDEFGSSKWSSGFVTRAASTGSRGVRIFVPSAELPELVRALKAAGIPEVSAEDARVVRLENGAPRYGEDITERYLVQETGLLHAVHFSKGCYLGQEIVERVRSRAQVHRHLKPLRISASAPPEAGTKLTLNGQNVAELTAAAYSPALGEVVALGYVRTEGTIGNPEFAIAGSDPAIAARLG